MQPMRAIILSAALATAAAALPAAAAAADKGKEPASAAAPAADPKAAPSGVYTPDAEHRHLLFSYNHQGYSTSFVRWRDWTGEIAWNADKPEKSSVAITIDATKVDSGVDIFDEHLRGEKFFDTAKHPTITFKSTSVKKTGPNKGTITGDLTIKGVTKPVTLDAAFNKAAFDQRGQAHKIGFSGKGVVKRSDWGLGAAVPFVGDEVTIIVEAEFLGPKKAGQ